MVHVEVSPETLLTMLFRRASEHDADALLLD